MRSFRQVFSGCKKHKYRFIRHVRWYEEEYAIGMRSVWICIICGQIVRMEMDVRSKYSVG